MDDKMHNMMRKYFDYGYDDNEKEYDPDAIYKIFVYGTLKKNFGNHHFLIGQKFIGAAKTHDAIYELYGSGVPYVATGGKFKIYGEVYEVDAQAKSHIDMLESAYREITIKVDLIATGKTIECSMYSMDAEWMNPKFDHPVENMMDHNTKIFMR